MIAVVDDGIAGLTVATIAGALRCGLVGPEATPVDRHWTSGVWSGVHALRLVRRAATRVDAARIGGSGCVVGNAAA